MKKIFCLMLIVLIAFYTVPSAFSEKVPDEKVLDITPVVPLAVNSYSPSLTGSNTTAASAEDTFEAALVNAIKKRTKTLDVERFGLTLEQLQIELKKVEYRNPMLYYWVVNDCLLDKSGIVQEVIITYLYTVSEVVEGDKYIKAHTDSVIALMPKGLSDLGKALWLHEYIIGAFDYDDFLKSRDILSMLKNGEGVCEAYVKVYAVLLSEVGVESSYKFSQEMCHVWNAVKIDGKWYNVDVTWNDGNGSYNIHKFFLLSDEAIDKNSSHLAADTEDYKCTDKKYDNLFLHDVPNSIGVNGKYLYYCQRLSTDEDPTLRLLKSDEDGLSESFATFDIWSYIEENKNWGKNCFTSAVTYKNKLIYCSEKEIKSYDFDTKKTGTIYTSTASLYGLYLGFSLDNPTLKYFEGTLLDGGSREKIKVKELVLEKNPEDSPALGDANGDGRIDTADASAILKYILKEGTVHDNSSDCNHDGRIDTADASLILKYILKEYDLK